MAILTVSREFGSGGGEIGRAVADSMDYQYVDRERIVRDIRKVGYNWEEWTKDLDEHCPSIWEKYDWSFRGFGALIRSAILNYAVADRVVIIGQGANFVLRDIPYSLRIRVIAPLEARIDRIMKRESVDKETARWLSEKMDRERSCFIYSLYGKHWDDPTQYDAIFNTGERSVEEIITIVESFAQGKDRFNTKEARETLKMHAEAARIKAGLATNPTLFIPTLEVTYDGKDLVLKGIIHNPREHQRLEHKARELAGSLPLKCELHYRK